MTTAIDTARFFLRLAADEEPEAAPLTHMHVQKLLYYVQGLSLAYRDAPMFEDEIQAWRHGPVVASVYPVFSCYGGNPVPGSEATPVSIRQEDRGFIRTVWDSYRGHSVFALSQMTHEEAPWKDAREGYDRNEPSTEEITQDSLKEFFSEMCARKMQQDSGITSEQVEEAEDDAKNGRVTAWETLRSQFA